MFSSTKKPQTFYKQGENENLFLWNRNMDSTRNKWKTIILYQDFIPIVKVLKLIDDLLTNLVRFIPVFNVPVLMLLSYTSIMKNLFLPIMKLTTTSLIWSCVGPFLKTTTLPLSIIWTLHGLHLTQPRITLLHRLLQIQWLMLSILYPCLLYMLGIQRVVTVCDVICLFEKIK